MESKLFLERYFLDLKHLTGLFYEWQPAIRFELGHGGVSWHNMIKPRENIN